MKLLTQQKTKVFGRPKRSLYVTNTVAQSWYDVDITSRQIFDWQKNVNTVEAATRLIHEKPTNHSNHWRYACVSCLRLWKQNGYCKRSTIAAAVKVQVPRSKQIGFTVQGWNLTKRNIYSWKKILLNAFPQKVMSSSVSDYYTHS